MKLCNGLRVGRTIVSDRRHWHRGLLKAENTEKDSYSGLILEFVEDVVFLEPCKFDFTTKNRNEKRSTIG